MFERFTEGARRVIFFARYEASKYGSPYIETEHLLLGVFREDRKLAKFYPSGSDVEPELRAEIEKHITRGQRIPLSLEVPLSQECKIALKLAAEAADRLGADANSWIHRVIEPEHLLIGVISVKESLAARILTARGLGPEPILDRIEKTPHAEHHCENKSSALLALVDFLDGFKTRSWQELMYFFAENAQFIDASGKQWNRDELASGFDALFAPYEKKNATYVVEATLSETHDLFVAVVRWNNALLTSEQRAWMHRMTLGLMVEGDGWKILSVQVTPADTSAVREGS
jgi:hypothetical protein